MKHTAEDLAHNEDLDVGREEERKDGDDHHDEETNRGVLGSVPVRRPSRDDEAEDFSRAGTVGQAALPGGGELVLARAFYPRSVLFIEDGGCVEIAQQGEVIAFLHHRTQLATCRVDTLR